MGLRHLTCWTNDHFIKTDWTVEETRFSRVRIFRIFEHLEFWKFEPIILCSFFGGELRWKALESHNSKQMVVYKQITLFINNRRKHFEGADFSNFRGWGFLEFSNIAIFGGLNWSRPKPNRTEPWDSCALWLSFGVWPTELLKRFCFYYFVLLF